MNRWGLLRDHDFRQLFVADTISQVGSQVSLLALPLVAVLTLHATPFEVGALAACDTAAFLLIGLPAGAWVDRMRRRSVLIAGDLGRAGRPARVSAARSARGCGSSSATGCCARSPPAPVRPTCSPGSPARW